MNTTNRKDNHAPSHLRGQFQEEQQASPPSLPVTPEATPVAAKAAAEFFGSCLMHHHRGIWDCGDKIVVFGNDGYRTDRRAQREVELVRDHLGKLGLPSDEFATDEDGYSWAFVVPIYHRLPVDIEDLREKLWEMWGKVCETK